MFQQPIDDSEKTRVTEGRIFGYPVDAGQRVAVTLGNRRRFFGYLHKSRSDPIGNSNTLSRFNLRIEKQKKLIKHDVDFRTRGCVSVSVTVTLRL